MVREGMLLLKELDWCVLIWIWRWRRLAGSVNTLEDCNILNSSVCTNESERTGGSSGPT